MAGPVNGSYSSRGRSGRRYGDVTTASLAAAAATLGVWAVLGTDTWGLGLVLLALATVGVAVRIAVQQRNAQGVLGSELAARSIIVAGVAVASRPFEHGGNPLAVGLAAAILIGAAAAEVFLRRAARFNPPVVAHLPGIAPQRKVRNPSLLIVTASVAATLLGLLIVTAGASSWWWVGLAALTLGPPAWLTVRSRTRVLQARRLRTIVPRALADYAPEFVVYTSRPDDASYQVAMWLPYLQRSGKRFVIITRNTVPAAALARLTDVPVIEARSISDLDALVPPSLKAAFYVNASSGNGVFVRYQHLTHVYLGHGDSDKPPSYNPTHAMYDRIFAAGPAAARRYGAHGVRIPPEKFQIVGRPQVEGVLPATGPIANVTQPVVLYAPTWRGHVEETMLYSLPVGEQLVSTLLARGATVIFRPHPFSYGFADDAATIGRIQALLAADAGQTGRAHLWGAAAETERGILDCINASDAMVSDVSSVVSDYLFSGKPFAMISVPSDPVAFVDEYPVAQAAYVVRGDLGDFDEILAQLLGPDQRSEVRAAIRVDYLGDFDADDYASAFVSAVREVASTTGDSEGQEDEEVTDDESSVSSTPSWARYQRLITGTGLGLLGTLLAVCALVSALWRGSEILTGGSAVAALLLGVFGLLDVVRDRQRWPRLLNEGSATRGTLLVAAAVVASTTTQRSPAVAVALVLLAAALATESQIRFSWGRIGLEVEGLPQLGAEVTERVPRGWLPLVNGAAILVVLVLVLASAPGWLVLAVSVVAFVIMLDVLLRALTRAARAISAEDRLYEALVELAPEFAVYFASTVGAAYQVGMWLPFLQRIGRPYIIVTRSVAMMREIAGVTAAGGATVPVIYRPSLRSLEEVVVPSLRAAFYVNNAVRNTHFVERRELTHVWLNHGDSEKPACFNPVHAIYDLLFAAGQAGIDRYVRHGVTIPREKFRIVGRPQVEAIEAARGPIAEQQPPTVLYAPTWQGPFADTRVYSLPMGREIVQRLLDRGARVIFRAHPFNYRYPASIELVNDIGRLLDADRASTGRQHLWGPAAEQAMTVEQCFNASDAMVSDVSAVVSDYLRSDKPFAIVSVGRTPEALAEEAPAALAAYVIRQDLDNLDVVLDDLLGPDPLASVRRKTKIYYLGDFGTEHYADGFLDAAREVIDSGPVG